MNTMQGSNVCRLCLGDGETLADIFDENGNLSFVEGYIEDLLQFQVVKDLRFPWLICPTCLGKLNDFRCFKVHSVECKIKFENMFLRDDFVPCNTERYPEIKEEVEDENVEPDASLGVRMNGNEWIHNEDSIDLDDMDVKTSLTIPPQVEEENVECDASLGVNQQTLNEDSVDLDDMDIKPSSSSLPPQFNYASSPAQGEPLRSQFTIGEIKDPRSLGDQSHYQDSFNCGLRAAGDENLAHDEILSEESESLGRVKITGVPNTPTPTSSHHRASGDLEEDTGIRLVRESDSDKNISVLGENCNSSEGDGCPLVAGGSGEKSAVQSRECIPPIVPIGKQDGTTTSTNVRRSLRVRRSGDHPMFDDFIMDRRYRQRNVRRVAEEELLHNHAEHETDVRDLFIKDKVPTVRRDEQTISRLDAKAVNAEDRTKRQQSLGCDQENCQGKPRRGRKRKDESLLEPGGSKVKELKKQSFRRKIKKAQQSVTPKESITGCVQDNCQGKPTRGLKRKDESLLEPSGSKVTEVKKQPFRRKVKKTHQSVTQKESITGFDAKGSQGKQRRVCEGKSNDSLLPRGKEAEDMDISKRSHIKKTLHKTSKASLTNENREKNKDNCRKYYQSLSEEKRRSLNMRRYEARRRRLSLMTEEQRKELNRRNNEIQQKRHRALMSDVEKEEMHKKYREWYHNYVASMSAERKEEH